MIHKLKNYIFRLLAALVLGTLIVTFIGFKYNNQHPQQAMNDSDFNGYQISLCPEHFRTHVDHMMTQTWRELSDHAGVSYRDCQNFLREFEPELKAEIQKSNKKQLKKLGSISPYIKNLIHEILVSFDIDPNTITILAFDGEGSPAAADDYTLFIDEKDFLSFSPEAQRFVIAHEIAHMKNKDHSIESALENLIDTKCRKSLNAFAHSSELRADIDAMLLGPEYARGGISFFKTLMNRYGDNRSATHPRPSDRLKIARDLEVMHTTQRNGYTPAIVAA